MSPTPPTPSHRFPLSSPLQTNVALVASVGAHVLLALAFPALSKIQPPPPIRVQDVEVVPLDASMQERLPDLDRQWDFDDFDFSLPTANVFDPLEDLGDPDSSLMFPSLSPSGLPDLPSPQLPIFQPLPPPRNLPIIPLPPPPQMGSPSITFRPNPLPSFEPSPPTPAPDRPAQKPNPDTAVKPDGGDRPQAPQTPQEPKENNPPLLSIAEEIAARQDSLEYDGTDTSNEDGNLNFVAWSQAIGEPNPPTVAIQGTYPLDACVRKLEGSAVYGVTLDSQGQVEAQTLIRSAGYPLFNRQAQKDIAQFAFETPGQAHLVTVDFVHDPQRCPDYDAILAPTTDEETTPVEPAPDDRPEPIPTPEPTDNPEPKDNPEPPAE